MTEPQESEAPDGWTAQARPPCLFRRFEFDGYAGTRAFLDRAATLSEETGLYPDISFGQTYANVTVREPGAEGEAVGPTARDFASRLSALV